MGESAIVNEVIRALYDAYPTIQDIVGHDEIAPGRKVDPGPLYWKRLYEKK